MIFASDGKYAGCLDELARLRVASIKCDIYEKAHEITPSYRDILSARGVLTERGQKASHAELATSLARGWRLGDVVAMDWLIKERFVRFGRARHEPTMPKRMAIATARTGRLPKPSSHKSG